MTLIRMMVFAVFLSTFTAIEAKTEAEEQLVDELVLQKTAPQRNSMKGTVMRAKTSTLAFPKDGRLVYVAPVGKLVKSQLTDEHDNVIETGDLIAAQDPMLYESEIKRIKERMTIAKNKYQTALTEFQRNQKLMEKQAVSPKTMLQSETDCKNAEAEVLETTQMLRKAEYDLQTCFIYAPYNGIIEETYFHRGTSVAKGTTVVKMSILSPAKIRIDLHSNEIKRLSQQDKISVFPAGNEQPLPAWVDRQYFGEKYIDIFVVNLPAAVRKLTPEQEKMPKVNRLLFASNIADYEKTVQMWIPPEALYKDDQGYYVMRATGQEVGKPVDQEFRVEKISVTPADKFMTQGIYNQRALSNAGILKKHDLLVVESSSVLKDGDQVVFSEIGWNFNPGEEVWVQIAGMSRPGYYVPVIALYKNEQGRFCVLIDENGKAREIEVKLGTEFGKTFSIEGEEVANNLKVIIPIDGQTITAGKAVKVRKTFNSVQEL